ncbi:hypothetical protein D9756_010910 [Leucocoprinus leucothites]|uniref:T6SS Phospholipase effector Tle1-like catalytic domain-containing protein n=1 Tax=Leucocoprinus leucothites TaxID=201217 RepID=A0A8H5FRF2_9AGAR|nr:hypothetical protein D9756_010910 [Leucoagaricus leucothites]
MASVSSSTPSTDPVYIPERAPTDTGRTLVLLFDGTGDKEDADVTNIIHFRDALLGWPNDDKLIHPETDKQLVYYQVPRDRNIQAIINKREVDVPILGTVSQIVDQAIAWSLPIHVTHGYQWLVKHYRPGDKISLFGFSRGAYTARARSLEAYKLFSSKTRKPKSTEDEKAEQEWKDLLATWTKFKADNNCRTVYIDFLGCWDTVNSVGLIRPIKLRYTRNNDIVRVFRHALALDEHRVRFKPNFWGQPKEVKEGGLSTDVEEVWFAGCHTDVGGGSVKNYVRPNLSHIPLRWMIRECFKKETGIIFKSSAIHIIGIHPSHLHPTVLPRPALPPSPLSSSIELSPIPPPINPSFLESLLSLFTRKKSGPTTTTNSAAAAAAGTTSARPCLVPVEGHPEVSEEQHDLSDALASAYDQLKLKAHLWRPMEYYPMVTEVHVPNAKPPGKQFKEIRRRHKGVGRTVPCRRAPNPNSSDEANAAADAAADADTCVDRGGIDAVDGDTNATGNASANVTGGTQGKVKVHRSVKVRMEATYKAGKKKGKNYVPKGLVGYGVKETFGEADQELFEWVD